jgi:hypothetical protein
VGELESVHDVSFTLLFYWQQAVVAGLTGSVDTLHHCLAVSAVND